MPDTATMEARIERVLALLDPLPGQIENLYERLNKTREEVIQRFASIEGSVQAIKAEVDTLKRGNAEIRIHDLEGEIVRVANRLERLRGEVLLKPSDSGTHLVAVHDLQRDAERSGRWKERLVNLIFVILAAILVSLITARMSSDTTPPGVRGGSNAAHTTP